MRITRSHVAGLVLAIIALWPASAAAQAAPGTPAPKAITLTAGSGYDTAQTSGIFGEGIVSHFGNGTSNIGWGWSVGGGLGIHGDARAEVGIHVHLGQVDMVPRFSIGVTGFLVAPISPFETIKAVEAPGAAIVIHISPLIRISGEYFHADSKNFRSGFGWSAMFLFPLFSNGD